MWNVSRCFDIHRLFVQGAGETGQLMVGHPQIAKMSFTGSVNTGAKIMAGCAEVYEFKTLISTLLRYHQ